MRLKTPLAGLSLAFLILSPQVWAQATRTWVSGVGDDANPCSRTAPCKTFAGAISKTAAGGEIDVLDPGGFGTVTITKAITIDGRGTFAGVVVAGTSGVVVQAAANDVVVLRGLVLNGLGPSFGSINGIRFISGRALHVEDCTITEFGAVGVDFEPVGASQLFVKGSVISENALGNILVSSGSAVVEKSELHGSGYGLSATQGARVSVHDTTFSGHTGTAIHASTLAEINVEHGLVANNGVGVQGDSTVRLSEVMVSNNVTGVTGTVASFGNNRIAAGNGTNGSPSATIPQQ